MNKHDKHNDILYGVEEQEYLDVCISIVEDQIKEEWCDEAKPTNIKILEFERMGVSVHDFLENIYESLDEEYASPDITEYTTPSEEVKQKATELAVLIEEEYVSWQCEPNGRVWVLEMPSGNLIKPKEK